VRDTTAQSTIIGRARALFPGARELTDESHGVFFIQVETEAFAPHLLGFVASARADV
jgi:hypothetical protein